MSSRKNTSKFKRQLQFLNACPESLYWLKNRSFSSAWAACNDPDWIMWLANSLNISLRTRLFVYGEILKIAIPFIRILKLKNWLIDITNILTTAKTLKSIKKKTSAILKRYDEFLDLIKLGSYLDLITFFEDMYFCLTHAIKHSSKTSTKQMIIHYFSNTIFDIFYLCEYKREVYSFFPSGRRSIAKKMLEICKEHFTIPIKRKLATLPVE